MRPRGIAFGPAALLVAAALAGGCGSSGPGGGGAATTVTIPVEATAPVDSTAQAVEPATDPAAVEAAPAAEPPAPQRSRALDPPANTFAAIWVRSGHEVEMRTEPGGGEVVARVGRRTGFGSPSVFSVVEHRGRWAGVTTERLANGTLGWIRVDPKRVDAGWTSEQIVVDLSERRGELIRDGEAKLSFPVTVGAPGSPTPTGRFAVTDTFTGLRSSAYGCCALALSATQPSLPSGWLGGDRIAIHGTSGPLGEALSHGCVRAADADVRRLIREVPLGAPVVIRD